MYVFVYVAYKKNIYIYRERFSSLFMQAKPNQTKPNQVKSNQVKPNQAKKHWEAHRGFYKNIGSYATYVRKRINYCLEFIQNTF